MPQSSFDIQIAQGKKFYFLSDFHLKNLGQNVNTEEREKCIVAFISHVQHDAAGFMFLGDVFDFWFEYKHLIPKGNIRLQAKWLELKDKGIPTYFICGNHDRWTVNYFRDYFGMKVFFYPQEFRLNQLSLFIGHGDGLGHSDKIYKTFKLLVTNNLGIWLLKNILPSVFVYRTTYRHIEKKQRQEKNKVRLPNDREWLIQFAEEYLKYKNPNIDYFLFGHRHLPIEYRISSGAIYINTGDWIKHNSYAVFSDNKIELISDIKY